MRTIRQDIRHETVIEKSRFICTLKKIADEEEAQSFIRIVKKEYWDATHNCSAYIVNDVFQRSSDDGEPSGTAGIPMLEVLRKNKLTGVAAVVTRYFGGVKLGAGGLVRAYSGSVAAALRECGLAEKVLMTLFSFICGAESAGKTLNLLYGQKLFEVSEVRYGESVEIILLMRAESKCEAELWLRDALNAEIELEETGTFYKEVPLEE